MDRITMKSIPDRVHVPVVLEARATVDREMFKRQYNGVKINDLTPLHPYHHFRDRALFFAKKWVADKKAQGEDLITAESDILVFGPFPHVSFAGGAAKSWRPATGARPTYKSTIRDQTPDEGDAADFVLRAMFIRHKGIVTR